MPDPDRTLRMWWSEFRSYAKEEFVSHLPYTVFGALIGLVFVISAPIFRQMPFSEAEFHTAHFVHVFFSAAAGSAIFRSYQGSILKAIPVVYVSSILLCSLSDSMIPYAGLLIFGTSAEVHICALEEPLMVSLFAAGGFLLGFVGIRFFEHCNRTFHLFHILISTIASALYMLSFVGSFMLQDILAVAITLFFALAIPCLVGDVALPLCFVKIRDPYLHEKIHHAKKHHAH